MHFRLLNEFNIESIFINYIQYKGDFVKIENLSDFPQCNNETGNV